MASDTGPEGLPLSSPRRTVDSVVGLENCQSEEPNQQPTSVVDIEMQRLSSNGAFGGDTTHPDLGPGIAAEAEKRNHTSTWSERLKSFAKRVKSDIDPAVESTAPGIPEFANFMTSDQNFMQFRRFLRLQLRILLQLQADISTLEEELDSMDWDLHEIEPLRNRLFDSSEAQEENTSVPRARRNVLEDIRVKVIQYDELLLKVHDLNALQRPTVRDYRSFRRMLYNKRYISDSDMDAMRFKEDIISLRHGREGATFDGHVEDLLWRLGKSQQTQGTEIYLVSPSCVTFIANLIIAFIIILLIAAPLLSMYKLSTYKTERATYAAVGVLMLFTVIFATSMSILTKAGRHELFAASAAYCAVLVVFIGSTTP